MRQTASPPQETNAFITATALLYNQWMPGENLMKKTASSLMEFLFPIAFLVLWFVLQAWVLPRFGVKT